MGATHFDCQPFARTLTLIRLVISIVSVPPKMPGCISTNVTVTSPAFRPLMWNMASGPEHPPPPRAPGRGGISVLVLSDSPATCVRNTNATASHSWYQDLGGNASTPLCLRSLHQPEER